MPAFGLLACLAPVWRALVKQLLLVWEMEKQVLRARVRYAMTGFLYSLLLSVPMNAAENQKAVPPGLIEYVEQVRRLGLPESEVRENARKAGWPDAQVTQALAAVKTAATSAATVPVPPPPPAPVAAAVEEATPAAAPKQPPAVLADDIPAGPEDYRIGAGDVLQINVWDEPKASVSAAVVRPDGRVGMPLIKEVDVLGLTPKQAERRITARLTALIPSADVTVVVSSINSKKIYAIGAVKKEGPIAYTYRMTVLQALSEAGGLNDYAKHKKIYVLRTEQGKEFRLPFDYDAVLKGQRTELNVTLMPNDVIVVPR